LGAGNYVVNKTTLETDLNKDGTVNILDIFIVTKAFGSKVGDANWSEVADLNNDGIVDILDIFAIARDYGKTV
jgi:endoglucanase